jgi:cytochrome c-type biogenesis protein CcmH/NrfG
MQMYENDATSPSSPTIAFVLHQAAVAAYDCRKIDVALRFMALACARPEAPGQCHRNYAEMLHRSGQSVKAEAAARLAVKRDPGCVEAWDTLGTILADRGALKESGDCYQRAIRIDPAFVQSLNNLAVVLYHLGQSKDAAAFYRRALKFGPENVEVQLNYANFLMDSKRHHESPEISNRSSASRTANKQQGPMALESKGRPYSGECM